MVYLQVPLEELVRRVQDLSTRGIAMEPGQTLADVMAFREPLYNKYADLTVPCPPGQELAQTAQIVLERLRAFGWQAPQPAGKSAGLFPEPGIPISVTLSNEFPTFTYKLSL